MNNIMQILKIDDQPDTTYTPPRHAIAWNYQYYTSATDVSSNTWKAMVSPKHLHQDPTDSSRMYLLGRYYGTATVIRFNKFNFQNDYMLNIRYKDWANSALPETGFKAPQSPMHDILSYVQPPKSSAIYGCGFSWEDATTELNNKKRATIFKMDSRSGNLIYMKMWGRYTATGYAGASDERDKPYADSNICRSVAFDKDTRQIIFLMEYVYNDLRPSWKSYVGYKGTGSELWSYNQADLVVVRMQEGGYIISGLNINFQKASVSMGIGEQALFIHK
jgi:hypothetical protein